MNGFLILVEMAGIEPASENLFIQASPSADVLLNFRYARRTSGWHISKPLSRDGKGDTLPFMFTAKMKPESARGKSDSDELPKLGS